MSSKSRRDSLGNDFSSDGELTGSAILAIDYVEVGSTNTAPFAPSLLKVRDERGFLFVTEATK